MEITYTPVASGELAALGKRNFGRKYITGFVKTTPGNVHLPEYYCAIGQKIADMKVREDDVWLVTYPKAGTTWTQEILWCIMNDLDFVKAKESTLFERAPFLELKCVVQPEGIEEGSFIDSVVYTENAKSPRVIKTHLPYALMPADYHKVKPKVVYVARNPKDVCVSYFHHSQLLEGYTGNFDEFCELFLGESLNWSPFWDHVLDFWKRKDDPNILFIKYEDMKKDLPTMLRKIANFVGKPLDDSSIARLADHVSFESMKANPSVNMEEITTIMQEQMNIRKEEGMSFIRKGVVGDSDNKMSPEITKKFERWTEENLKNTDFRF